VPRFTVSGLASNVDWQSMVAEIMRAERAGLNRIIARQARVDNLDRAWTDLGARLGDVRGRAAALRATGLFSAHRAESSNPSLVGATAGAGATAGTHQLRVQSLAAHHRIVSTVHADPDAALGLTGSFQLNGRQVTVGAQHSLRDLVALIGATDAGVQAAVVTAAPGQHYLVLTASRSGTANAISLTDGTGGVATALGLLTAGGVPNTLTPAADAVFELNGLTLTRSANRVDDAVAGLSLELRATGPEVVRVSVVPEPEASQDAVQAFVTAYNSALRYLRTALASDGTLAGDAQAIRLQGRLRNLMNSAAEGDLQLWQVGITFAADRSGELVLDAGRFLDAVRSNPDGVQALLSGRALAMEDFLGAILRPGDGLVPARDRTFDEQRASLDRELRRGEDRLAAQERLWTMRFLAMERMVSGLARQSNALAMPLDRLMGGETRQ
jgi:flagellar hook-associated protein 2